MKKALEEQGRAHQEASHKLERRLQAALKAAEVCGGSVGVGDGDRRACWVVLGPVVGRWVCASVYVFTEQQINTGTTERPNQAAEARAAEADEAGGSRGATGAGDVANEVDVEGVKEQVEEVSVLFRLLSCVYVVLVGRSMCVYIQHALRLGWLSADPPPDSQHNHTPTPPQP